jgi:hypothetical protein
VVESNPSGVELFLNGERRGVTPAKLSLAPGDYTAELRGLGEMRVIVLKIAPGAQVSHYIDIAAPARTGTLEVRSQPDGARVIVDGSARGVTPLVVGELAIGSHEVLLQTDATSIRQTVTIEPGATASLVVPLSAPAGPVSGWISVSMPFDAQIFETGRLIGTTSTDRLMLSVGRHELEFVNDVLGYRQQVAVQVLPGKVAPVRPELPRGVLNVNAVPWAEVWIDGDRAGETPIGNMQVAIGAHEIVFRHPQFGERKAAVTVKAAGAARVSVDMRQ